MSLTVDELAKEMEGLVFGRENRTVREVAEALLPFIERHIAAGQQGAGGVEVERLAKQMFDAQKDKLAVDWERQWQPTKDYWIAKATTHAAAPKPAGAVPKPMRFAMIHGLLNPQENGTLCRYEDAIRYGDAREAAGRAGAVLSLPEDGAYIIKFDDASVEDEFFAMGDAREIAFHRFDQISGNWNAHLFVKIRSNNQGNPCPSAEFTPLPQQPAAEGDDIAVDRFAEAMKAKMAAARAKGRGGWEGPTCNADILSRMLRDHVEKGDPRDVANFCMMLWNRGEAIQASTTPAAVVTDEMAKRLRKILKDRWGIYFGTELARAALLAALTPEVRHGE